MPDLTLRQVEVIRAVMMTGTIQGAAEFLNVSAPGISRLIKHTEEGLGVRLFERRAGLFAPAAEAAPVFEQIQQIHQKMAGLSFALDRLKRGAESELAFASMPSVAQFIAARAVMQVRRHFPELYIDLNVLKIEETVEYLLLERGEFVATSYRFDHPSLAFRRIGTGELVVILPDGHRLAHAPKLSVAEIADEPLIGVDAGDPYGEITSRPFAAAGLPRRLSVKARFAQTVVSLVRHGLGVAIIDEFSVAGVYMPGLARVPLADPVPISLYIARKDGRVLSSYADYAIDRLRDELRRAVASRPWRA
ncbi:MAG: LysR family transcriptional regulator [Amaricoccus sp.]